MANEELINAILSGVAQDKFGLAPFDPTVNTPRDMGLGGVSTEYTSTDLDQSGRPMNYPQIWWDKQREPHMLSPEQAYSQAIGYEKGTLNSFPRYDSLGQAEFAAQNRSAMEGGELGPIATLFRGLLP